MAHADPADGLSCVAGALPLDGANSDLCEKLAAKDGRVTEDLACRAGRVLALTFPVSVNAKN
jgi:hypothetical protein